MTERSALWAAIGLLAGLCALSMVLVLDAQQHQNDALRSIMCRAEHVVRIQPGIPAKQRRQAIHFYRVALGDAHLKPCQ